MIIYIDGPEKAGKTTLANELTTVFKDNSTIMVKNKNRAKMNGFEYLDDFIAGISSSTPYIWDRGWASEWVYGKLLDQDRYFVQNPFLAEWVYGRMMNGRGNRFILLPEKIDKNIELRDDSDINKNPKLEIELFKSYANMFGYIILENDYTPKKLRENVQKIFVNSMVQVNKSSPKEYVGPVNPEVTFIGDVTPQFKYGHYPFFNSVSSRYFKVFGKLAITKVGYMTIKGAMNPANFYLLKNPVNVGSAARTKFPEWPTLPDIDHVPTTGQLNFFIDKVTEILREILDGQK